jgi:hypothetical protein
MDALVKETNVTTQRFGPECASEGRKTRGSVGGHVFRGFVGTAALVALVGGLAGTASAAPGDTATGTSLANVTVGGVIALTALTPTFNLPGNPGSTVTGGGAVTFNVQTNNLAGYTVTVESATPVLSPPTGNPDSIPIGNLSVRETGTGTFTALSNIIPVVVHTQATRSAPLGDSLSNDYQVVIPFVNQGVYTATLNYVATAL